MKIARLLPLLLIGWLLAAGCSVTPPSEGPGGAVGPGWPAGTMDSAFEDVTIEAGLEIPSRDLVGLGGTGVAVGDVDGDGWPDLYFSGGSRITGEGSVDVQPRLFLGSGGGVFEDVSDSWGLWSLLPPNRLAWAGPTFADFDRDGDPDLFLGGRGQNSLLINEGESFRDDTDRAEIAAEGLLTWAGGVLDFDADGWLDLYIYHHQYMGGTEEHELPPQNGLYRGTAEGVFVNRSDWLPTPPTGGATFVAAVTDLDGNGYVDIYDLNDHGGDILPNQLYRNNGPTNEAWSFVRTTEDCGCDLAIASMGVAVSDLDRDGYKDFFVTNLADYGGEVLLWGSGDGGFVDGSAAAGVVLGTEHERPSSWGTEALDYDNDGWSDLMLVYSSRPEGPDAIGRGLEPAANALLRNRGDGTFEEVAGAGLDGARMGASICATVLDYDRDGCMDIVVDNSDGSPSLLRNRCEGLGNWIGFDLVGVVSNLEGVGAELTLTVTDGALPQHGEVFAGTTSICSSRWKTVHFGLGKATEVGRVEVRWPSGQVDVLQDLAGGAYYQVTEGLGVTSR